MNKSDENTRKLASNYSLHQSTTYLIYRGGWFSSFFGCLTPILNSIRFNKPECTANQNWEVPFSSIRNLKYLNAGSEGRVFKGRLNNQTIAIKKVNNKRETEIKHLKNLKHNNIVRFIGICTTPEYCVLMEFCEFGTLSDYLRTKKRSIQPELIWEFAFQIASGMNYLHYNNVVHRDLKTSNILLAQDNLLKISDFGVSKELRNESCKMSFVGTCAYIAPEIIRNEKCSKKIDIWSYGIVIWEMLTCEQPYAGIDSPRLLMSVANNAIRLPISNLCPDGFKLLMEMCWSLQPSDRPSFKQILLHLQVFCKEEMNNLSCGEFNEIKNKWRKEIENTSLFFIERVNVNEKSKTKLTEDIKLFEHRKEELTNAICVTKQVLDMYKTKLYKVSELFEEVDSFYNALKKKEAELEEKK